MPYNGDRWTANSLFHYTGEYIYCHRKLCKYILICTVPEPDQRTEDALQISISREVTQRLLYQSCASQQKQYLTKRRAGGTRTRTRLFTNKYKASETQLRVYYSIPYNTICQLRHKKNITRCILYIYFSISSYEDNNKRQFLAYAKKLVR